MVRLTNRQARHLVLHLQGLTMPPHLKQSAAELFATICQLGFVQVDSIQWVERAHHMTLFARNQTYRPQHLKSLIENDRLLFEGWTHDASIIPAEYYRFWKRRFQRKEERLRKNFIRWQGEGFLGQCDDLMELISKQGPVRSRDLERPKRDGPQEMWQWHDGKAALEYLWQAGHLAISARDGFQKVYDLSARFFNEKDYCGECDQDEFVDWACRSALERLGFGTPADISRYWNLLSIQEVRQWLSEQDDTAIEQVELVTADGSKLREAVAFSGLAKRVEDLPKIPDRIRILSPFDPVIRDRKRLEWLFDFDYRIEIYVPAPKRKYGYYVFPILEKDRIIGRIDMRANRPENELQIKQLWLEPGVLLSNARKARLDAELIRQARLGSVDKVIWLNQ